MPCTGLDSYIPHRPNEINLNLPFQSKSIVDDPLSCAVTSVVKGISEHSLELTESTLAISNSSRPRFGSNKPINMRKITELATLLWNVQGLSNKCNIVEDYILDLDIDIFCLVEHWLCQQELDVNSLKNYKLSSSYCRPNRRHGGCAIFVKDNITHRPINSVNMLSVEMVFEVAASFLVDINTIVVVIYRPNVESKDFKLFIDQMNMLLEHLGTYKADIILCGDFNIDFRIENDLHSVLLNSVFSSFNLDIVTKEITRPKPGGGSCLDNIITCKDRLISSVVLKTVVSDHWAVLTKTHVSTVKHISTTANNSYKFRVMKNENVCYFNGILSEVDWSYMYNSLHNVDDKVKFFMNQLLHVTNKAFPRKNVAGKLSRPKPGKVHSLEIDLCKEECSLFYDYYVSTGSHAIKKLYKNCKKN